MSSLLPRLPALAFGGDYNPEQWPEDVWREDVELMRTAGVNLVTVGVFSWAMLQPAPDVFAFEWLDRVLDGLAGAGIAVDLATATASPPPWFSVAHPDSLPVDATGRRLRHGSRQAYCPSSPAYRRAALALVEAIATRYADHPALTLWHVNNEYGCHVSRCYCDVSAAAFRAWLQRRYGDLDALNTAWGTSFWSQRYTDWGQILPPGRTPTFTNPTQELDFRRFSDGELLDCFRAERDALHRLSPGVPVTTNLMAGPFWDLDYWRWAAEMDVVSTDHYLVGEGPGTHIDLAFAADLTRSLAGGRPWLLMEHSTSAVNWQPRNLAKRPGQLTRNSLAHVARGSDGALFFQWRQSRAGAEKWHSAMLPHAGTDTDVWREVVRLGSLLAGLDEVAGSVPRAEVAVLLDYESVWAQQHPAQPSVDMDSVPILKRWHAALWQAGVLVDFAHPRQDLSRYRMVVVPALHLVDDDNAANVADYVHAGGTLLVGPYSGVVDENDHVRPGGYPGAWRDLLGVRVQQYLPLPAGTAVTLSDGSSATRWTEDARAGDATVVATYTDGPAAGRAALTRRPHGAGVAWYLGTHPSEPDLRRILAAAAGIGPGAAPEGVEVVRRHGPDAVTYLFVINHSLADAAVPAVGTLIPEGTAVTGSVTVPAGGCAVVKEPAAG
jgi:beta-galactosidase